MVDWSIGDGTHSAEKQTSRKTRQRVSTNNLRILEKLKPQVSATNRHLLHSGKKQPKSRTFNVKKVKRDSAGNVLNSRLTKSW